MLENETELAAVNTKDISTTMSINSFADMIVDDVRTCGYYATFSTEGMKGSKRLFSATNSAELLREYMETPITVADIVFSPTVITNETGETDTVLGTYIIDKDGNSYVSSSNGVARSAMQILSQFGMPDTWDEDLSVVCRESNTAKGRRFKFLDIV